jgi:pimeloyl-ACP methyl ester carboxylesterase
MTHDLSLDVGPEPAVVTTSRGAVEFASFGSGPAVLCLHGAMGGHDQSLLLGRTIGAPGYRYIGPSRPGYLGTPLSCGRSPEEQADLYASLLDALHVDRCAVMAVSGGGPSALHFAQRHRDRCWGLVLVSTVADRLESGPPLSFAFRKLLLRLPGVASAARRRVLQDPESAARRSVTNPELFDRLRGDAAGWALLRELQASTTDRMFKRFPGTDNDIHVSLTRSYPLEDIAVPTLVVHGSADPMVPFERNGRVFAKRIPGSKLLVLEGGEHAAIFTHRREAQAEVAAFLSANAAVSAVVVRQALKQGRPEGLSAVC